MLSVVFFVNEMTFIRYFIPLAQECARRDFEVTFAIGRSGKYNCPLKHEEELRNLIYEHVPEAKAVRADKLTKIHDVEVVVEGISCKGGRRVYSLSYMTDFRLSMENYYDRVDFVCLPSAYFYDKFNIQDPEGKVLAFGSPKYDINPELLDMEEDLSNTSLMLYHPKVPTATFVSAIQIEMEYGRDVLIKTRGKHPIGIPTKPINNRTLTVMSDEEWFPHTTMKLIRNVAYIVNFDSTAIKEIVMLLRRNRTKNVHVKDFVPLSELYLPEAKEKYLWDFNSSVKLVDHMLATYMYD